MNADYEEMLLQITDVLKAHNRYHMQTPDHEQAVKLIRDIVTPKGKWIIDGHHIRCNRCNEYMCNTDNECNKIPDNFCPNCGAHMGGLTYETFNS